MEQFTIVSRGIITSVDAEYFLKDTNTIIPPLLKSNSGILDISHKKLIDHDDNLNGFRTSYIRSQCLERRGKVELPCNLQKVNHYKITFNFNDKDIIKVILKEKSYNEFIELISGNSSSDITISHLFATIKSKKTQVSEIIVIRKDNCGSILFMDFSEIVVAYIPFDDFRREELINTFKQTSHDVNHSDTISI